MQTMERKKRLLIICQQQYGYHTDTYEFAKKLKECYEITSICWEEHLPKVSTDKVNIVYVSKQGNKILSVFRFRYTALKILANKFDVIFINYFVGASLVPLFANKTAVIFCHVVTGAISKSRFNRTWYNTLLHLEVSSFKNRSFLSKNLGQKLGFKKFHILPLGATLKASYKKNFSELNLIYIGTFNERRIEDAIIGFGKFYHKYKNIIPCNFTIIGSGNNEVTEKINTTIKNYSLENIVELKGYIHRDKLDPFYEKGNIGISYVPITKYFDCQPPTKTYEYLLSGMAVLATATKENKLVINEKNGVLINDTPDAFCEGLEKIYHNRFYYDSGSIQADSNQYSWDNIVESNLKKYLTSLN